MWMAEINLILNHPRACSHYHCCHNKGLWQRCKLMMKCLCEKWPSSIITVCYRSVMTYEWLYASVQMCMHVCVTGKSVLFVLFKLGHACVVCLLYNERHSSYSPVTRWLFPSATIRRSACSTALFPNCGNSAQEEMVRVNVITNKFWYRLDNSDSYWMNP